MNRLSSVTLLIFQVFLQRVLISCQSLKITWETCLIDGVPVIQNLKGYEPAAFGGIPTFNGEFPFMVGFLHKCKLPDVIYLGGNPLSTVDETFENVFKKFSVVNVTIFPDYDPRQGYDDIAILELDRPTWLTPICLWNNTDLTSDEVTAIGYGLTEFAGLGSQQLLKVNLTVFSSDFCKPFFKHQRKFKMGLSEAHICAGDKEGIKDTCQGDSGGPLLLKHNNKIFAVGITSSGQACSGFPPAIYTKISAYTDWIADLLEERDQFLRICDV